MSLRSFIQGPAPIERALLRAVNRSRQQLISSIYAPNRCTIRLAESHHRRAQPLLPILQRELGEILGEHIVKRGWKTVTSAVELDIVADPDLRDGQIEIDCEFVEQTSPLVVTEDGPQAGARESSPSGLWLRFENGDRVPLWPIPFTIGREEGDLALPDPHRRLSRRHCQIVAAGEGLEVIDLGSTNGTVLNGRQVDRAPLGVGESLELGEHRLTVEGEEMGGFGDDSLAL